MLDGDCDCVNPVGAANAINLILDCRETEYLIARDTVTSLDYNTFNREFNLAIIP